MGFKFGETKDGYMVHSDEGRAICRLETKTVVSKKVIQPPDGREVYVAEGTTLDLAGWKIHFCAGRFSVDDIEQLAAAIKRLPRS